MTVDIEFLCARAHYYHAVGLTERDDIVGACEHYLTALEIMEDLMAKDKRLKSKWKEKAHGSQLIAHSSKKSVDRCLLTVDNPEDYEKIRFLALTYTRLGRLFYNENYYDLAMLKYKKALKYYNIIDDTISESYTYKNIGNVYQLLGKTDSALHHYRKSLEIYSGLINKLDIEKSIALILFNKGERDSAYTLIKNNLDKIDNYGSKYSYYATLGNMYYVDKKYDSAIFYFNKEFVNQDIITNNFVFAKLSAIYDSLGFYEMKTYYDNIRSELSIIMINKDVSNNRIQSIYDNYKKRKIEKERLENKKKTNLIVSMLIEIISLSIIIIFLIWHKSKRKDKYIAGKEEIISKTNEEIKRRESEINELVEIIGSLKSDINSLKNDVAIKEYEISGKETEIKKMENDLSARERDLKRLQENVHESRILINKLNENHKTNEERIAVHLEEIEKLKTEINQAQNNLNDLRFKNSFTEGKIKKQNAELKKKEELIGKYTTEISNLKYRLERKRIDVSNLNNYLQSDICSRILNEINELSDKKLKGNMLSPLSKEEFVLLLNSANHHLNYFINDMAKKYPKLKKEDLYYLCFVIMGLDNNQIASLFGVTYDTAKKREKKICVIFDLDPKENLSNYLLHLV